MQNDFREPLSRSEHFFILNIKFGTADNIALLNNFGNIHSGVSCKDWWTHHFGVGNATCTSRLITPARLHTTLVDLAARPTLSWCNDLHLLPHCEHNTEMQLHYHPAPHTRPSPQHRVDIFRSFSQLHLHPLLATINNTHQEHSSTVAWESTSDHTSSWYTSSLLDIALASIDGNDPAFFQSLGVMYIIDSNCNLF